MSFEILHNVVDKAVKLGADDALASLSLETGSQIKFVNSRIITGMGSYSKTMWIFIAKDRKIATTSIQEFSEKSVDEVLKKLVSFVGKTQPDEEYNGIAEGPFRYKEIEGTFDKRLAELGESAVDHIEGAVNAAANEGAKRTAGLLENNHCESFLVTSNDVEASDMGTEVSFSIRAFADKNASGHKVSCSRTLKGFNPELAGLNAGRIAKDALHPAKGAAGRFDVIFDPLPFACLLDCVIESASIFAVEAGLSFFAGMLGKKVAGEGVTLVDDGSFPYGMSSAKFDDEGVPTQRNVVVKDGVLKTYLHNTSTAKRYKTKTTANAGIIEPEPWNVMMDAGSHSLDELFGEVKNGLYITNTWYTRFQNYLTGDFSTIPRDAIFTVKNGEIGKPVSDLRVSHNMLELLRNIGAISKEREQIVGWEVETPAIAPAVLVRDVNITKSSEKHE